MTKIPPELAARAQQMRNEGMSVTAIAAEFGVTGQTIYNQTTKPRRKAAAAPEAAEPKPAAPKPRDPRKRITPEPPRKLGRWRVIRARALRGFDRGWFAVDGIDSGAWFPTWPEAWAFALTQAREEDRKALDDAAAFGLMKMRGAAA